MRDEARLGLYESLAERPRAATTVSRMYMELRLIAERLGIILQTKVGLMARKSSTAGCDGTATSTRTQTTSAHPCYLPNDNPAEGIMLAYSARTILCGECLRCRWRALTVRSVGREAKLVLRLATRLAGQTTQPRSTTNGPVVHARPRSDDYKIPSQS